MYRRLLSSRAYTNCVNTKQPELRPVLATMFLYSEIDATVDLTPTTACGTACGLACSKTVHQEQERYVSKYLFHCSLILSSFSNGIKTQFFRLYNAKYVNGMKILMAFINKTAKRINTMTPKMTALNGLVTELT